MSVSPSVQTIICEEIFDESSHPSLEEINEYASKIGIDPVSEPHLLHLAKEGLMQALPSDWRPCYDEKSKSYYYYNSQSGKTQWEHPLDNIYRSMVSKARSESQASFDIDEDSKGQEDHTYTKEDLQSFEESVPKPLSFAKPPLSPVKKLEPINLGARKKDIKLSPVKIKSKSMQDFAQKSTDFLFERTGSGFGKQLRKNSRSNIFGDNQLELQQTQQQQQQQQQLPEKEKILENKFLFKNDKHPNSIEKGELTLSGGGAMFLKSNVKKLVTQNSDSQLLLDIGTSSSTGDNNIEYLPKSILRDRSLPETHTFKEFSTASNHNDDDDRMTSKKEPDDDRKSVRFNLNATTTATQDIDFNFSDDSDEKDSFEEEIEIFAENKIKATKELTTIKTSRFTVSPVLFDEYAPKKSSDSIFAKIDSAEKLEEHMSPRNSNLKLIKPNPTDFITPKIIAKPLDVIKPISILSDSEDESVSKYKAKFPTEENLMTEKLANVQDSIPEENTADRSIDISYSEKLDVTDNNDAPTTTKNPVNKINDEVKNNLEKYKQTLLEENQKEMESIKKSMVENKDREIEKLRKSVLDAQKNELEELLKNEKESQEKRLKDEADKLREEMSKKYKQALEEEEQKFEVRLKEKKTEMENQFQQTLDDIEKSFKEKEKEIESNFQMSLKQTETDFLLKLEERIKEISIAHKAVIDRMKDDHELTLAELMRDFKSEEEIVRKEHQQHLADLRDKVHQELEIERQRMRELGEDRLYEKVRCEKRLLEDKYRCLKEKYLRLKSDVKVSLERRSRRKEQSLTTTTTTTTGSDTERSTSHKKGSNSERPNVNAPEQSNKKERVHSSNSPKHLSKSHKQSDVNSTNNSNNRTKADNKNIQQIIIEDLDTSLSDRSHSKQHSSSKNDNELPQQQQQKKVKDRDLDSSDGISNHGRSRRKLFTRLKSNSTSRLNNNSSSNKNNKELKRSCSPVENLRRQLQKLEDLEDQFPQTTAPSDTYHLRYPFTDSGDAVGSSELEFFRHRIHLERDSVRRAKESLRTQRTNFQKRQRELKLRHGSAARHTLQQLYQEERELSDMEVSLHRTRSLLGEKVIRLRHLEQSLQRLSVTSSSNNKHQQQSQQQQQDDATLSDLSSHSASSGISSTEFATATDNVAANIFGNGKTLLFREEHLQESSEIMQSLENLNSEIREIWDVLNKQQHAANVTTVMPPVPLMYSEHVWPVPTAGNVTVPTLNAIPTLADRLHDYHQRAALAAQGVQSIVVSQPPRASQGAAVTTTTLVERTKNLRDWLRQTKADLGENATAGQATL